MDEFFARHMAGHQLIGVHARGTDATSKQELRRFRQGSLVLSRYVAEIERLLDVQPRAKIFVASDEQSSLNHLTKVFGHRVIAYESVRHDGGEAAGQGPTGWIMPAYIARDRDVAARNGEDAVIEYLLLTGATTGPHGQSGQDGPAERSSSRTPIPIKERSDSGNVNHDRRLSR